jgi:hypothetical protein
MKQYPFWLVAGLVVVLRMSPPAFAKRSHIRYRCQVYRLSEGFDASTSLQQDIWEGDKAQWQKMNGAVTLFDQGCFTWGQDRLDVNDQSWSWNEQALTFAQGTKAALPGHKIKMVYAPNLLKREGELIRLKVESKQPFQYLKRREDNLFELAEMSLPVGMDLKIKAYNKPNDMILVSYLEIELRMVGRREVVPGVNLPIGRPLLQECEYVLRLAMREGRSYGIMLRPADITGAIVIRLEVDDR